MNKETANHIAHYVVWNTLDALIETEGYTVQLEAMMRIKKFMKDQLEVYSFPKE